MNAHIAARPALQAELAQNLKTKLPRSFVKLGLDIDTATLRQERFKMIDDIGKPFVEINISTGEIQLSPGLFTQFTVREGKKATASNTQNATNGTGGPSANSSAVNVASGNNAQANNTAPVKAGKPLPPIPKKPTKPLPQPPIAGNKTNGSF